MTRCPGTSGPLFLLLWLFLSAGHPLLGQSAVQSEAEPLTRWEFAGVPALTYNSDEGFGYGAVMEMYKYGGAEQHPYLLTIRPKIYMTTKGRRDVTVFFDAPHLLPTGWRIDVFVGSKRQIATPYYGVGNRTGYDPALEEDPNPYYYRFERIRRSVNVNLQRKVGDLPLRILVGIGVSSVGILSVPEDSGTTLLHQEIAQGRSAPEGWFNSARLGLVWDTRDRETGPRRGAWTDVLVQRIDENLEGDWNYTRWTITDRRYFSPTRRLTLANRFLLQDVSGNAPFHELHRIQSSFEQKEGLGGEATVRGMLRNRYTGKGLFIWNLEARWRVLDWSGFGRDFHAVVTGFVDSGRVWADGLRVKQLFTDLHHGAGAGLRIGMGENFIVAVDAARGDEAGIQIYTGLGYLF
ncbi:BamA/TamA family outer membrane protein [Gemmatimonadota bacterium]